jgi:hypothetical protein
VRQIRMLRARRRELETGLRRLPHGHEGKTPATAKELPTDYRASSRPYRRPGRTRFSASIAGRHSRPSRRRPQRRRHPTGSQDSW